MLIDTHGHVNFNAFQGDNGEVLKRALEKDTWVIMPGTQYETSKRAVEIAESASGRGVYAAIGLHPIHIGEQRRVDVLETQSEDAGAAQPWETFETRSEEFSYAAYKNLAKSKKVVAIGEVGLDYYYFPKSKAKREQMKQKQRDVLEQQMRLADECNLPVILHCRVAHDDLIGILEQRIKRQEKKMRGVVHSYTGTVEQAQRFLDLGLYFGFNGLIFKNVPALPDPAKVIASIPFERIVLETDSPYLVPPQAGPPRQLAGGGERNEPLFVKYVAEEIARIKKLPFEEVAGVTTQNARKLFGLDGA
ncbi:MAG: hypothetical protein A3J30_01585 [Candidatus Wildermuthbacteria bacterium RIFCSPLOWO2_02_FULL_47_9c]|uniref:Hydrolase TatD n=2 Tax=Parcubacteria group TaxID=1794811 RepID=A0A1G2RV98_9BACT|nr:MAG: YabD protein [Parcubacteria group bacterium GW2011_GWB1_49_12]KKW08895.1 MAG: YabD protein [Parcubacteria group bacterium GW2011_GWA1_49_26]KKW13750.1 MAG: YabD protein [Parcubacteria group bacterium GW2011_GWA2_50_10]OHA61815.1 MAG: hypothetical protein A2109_00520 [Candidatus Wildermuthbacteria bacterium GWA1_49_26]OHA65323.1 MAG: hypothetical protein A2674_00720 [Candidatus Wildermuthbacteria bacterium RIFCSPHIGHO2_01_FULL_50_47]OHA69555.1 MAG: hypothetical protein A3D63_03090 [Cand